MFRRVREKLMQKAVKKEKIKAIISFLKELNQEKKG
jgi:SOS response regulatory protein OraA/RecX